MKYFISYVLTNDLDNSFGIDNEIIDFNRSIIDIDDIRLIEDLMERKHHGESVSLIMYKEIIE